MVCNRVNRLLSTLSAYLLLFRRLRKTFVASWCLLLPCRRHHSEQLLPRPCWSLPLEWEQPSETRSSLRSPQRLRQRRQERNCRCCCGFWPARDNNKRKSLKTTIEAAKKKKKKQKQKQWCDAKRDSSRNRATRAQRSIEQTSTSNSFSMFKYSSLESPSSKSSLSSAG